MSDGGISQEKGQRLKTAELLLEAIKELGGTAKEASEFLKTSPTKLSHWATGDEDRKRRVGAPSDIELKKLVGYLTHQVEKKCECIMDIALGYRLRMVERLILMMSMKQLFEAQAELWDKEFTVSVERYEEMISSLRDIYEKQGPEAMPLEMIQSMYLLGGQKSENESLEDINFNRLSIQIDHLQELVKNINFTTMAFFEDPERTGTAEELMEEGD